MRTHAAAGIMLGVLLLAACGGKPVTAPTSTATTASPSTAPTASASATPSETPTSTPTPTPTPAPETATTAATAARATTPPAQPATQALGVALLDSHGRVSSGFVTDTHLAGTPFDCYGPSPGGRGSGTFACGSNADSLQFCVGDPSDPHVGYCIRSVEEREVYQIGISDLQPGVAQSPIPFELQLADGSTWTLRTGGAVSPTPGYYMTYFCSSGCRVGFESLYRPESRDSMFDTTRPAWTVLRGSTENPSPVPATITKVWYLQGA